MSSGESLIGTLLGDYQILSEIGHGGMGIVYRARQQSLDRIVAVKILPQEFCKDAGFVDRFLREARSAANLNHMNIVQVFDAGVQGDTYFFVMEYVDGQSLGQLLEDQGAMEEVFALNAIQQAARGLSFAHGMGVIHRDVKPDNLMMLKNGIIKVGDLGLAKWKMDETSATLTTPGVMMGTPYYVAPEQIRGLPDVDGRADIYALGMTFFHLLTGTPAFSSGTAPEIMAQHLSEEPPSIKDLNPKVSQHAANLFRKMTVKKRENRIHEMSEVVDLIDDILGNPRNKKPSTHKISKSTSFMEIMRSEGFLERFLKKSTYAVFAILAISVLTLLYLTFRTPKSKSLVAKSQEAKVEKKNPVIKREEPKSPSVVKKDERVKNLGPPKSSVSSIVHPQPDPVSTAPLDPKTGAAGSADLKPAENVSREISKKVYHQFGEIRLIAISEKSLDFNRFRIVLKKSVGSYTKILIRPDFLRTLSDAEMILKYKGAILELPIHKVVSEEKGFAVELHKILVPWGDSLPSDSTYEDIFGGNKNVDNAKAKELWQEYLKSWSGAVNWEFSSVGSEGKAGRRWGAPGAGKAGEDFALEGVMCVDGSTSAFLSNSDVKLLRFQILNDLQDWARQVLKEKKYVPHYGWILFVSEGNGGLVFNSVQESGGVGSKVRIMLDPILRKKTP